MKYYIQEHDPLIPLGIWRIVKRLKDFKAKNNVEYIVTTHLKPINDFDSLPIYIGKDNKLKKTKNYAVFTSWG
jgi:hypothetical protein